MKQRVGYSIFVLLCIGVFFFPLWLQVVLFFLIIFLIDKKYLLFIPALISDLLYVPENTFFLPKAVIGAVVVLFLVMIINKTTRITI
jgi:hypothetical protein